MSVSTTRSKSTVPVAVPDRNGAIPPLNNGDRLTRDEFMRRYEAMPDLKKAELIEGVVYVGSPVNHENHGEPHMSLGGYLFLYRARTPGVQGGDNSTVLLSANNCPQPDNMLFIEPASGGQVRIDDKGYIVGAPDLVAEVSASTVSYDLHDKLRGYERNGVSEYIIWRVLEHEVDWFVLRNQSFEKLKPEEDGTLRSTIFPGLWLDPAALLTDDFERLLAVLQRGLDSPEHAEFIARLREAKASKSGDSP